MPRVTVPESRKLRTVPVRITKPMYRTFMALLELTGVSLQEQLRRAAERYLADARAELSALHIEFPHELVMGTWSDPEFERWMNKEGKFLKAKVATAQAEAPAQDSAPVRRTLGQRRPQPAAS